MAETRRPNLFVEPSPAVLSAGIRASTPRAGEFSMPEVKRSDGEKLEGALRRFKHNLQQEDISTQIKRLSCHLKEAEERSRAARTQPKARNRKQKMKDLS